MSSFLPNTSWNTPSQFVTPLVVTDSCYHPDFNSLPRPSQYIEDEGVNHHHQAIFRNIDLFPVGNSFTKLESKLLYRHLAAILREELYGGDPYPLLSIRMGGQLEVAHDQMSKEEVLCIDCHVSAEIHGQTDKQYLQLEFRYGYGSVAPKSVSVTKDPAISAKVWSLLPAKNFLLGNTSVPLPQDAMECCIVAIKDGESTIKYDMGEHGLSLFGKHYFGTESAYQLNNFVKFAALRMLNSVPENSGLSNYVGNGVITLKMNKEQYTLTVMMRVKTADYKGKIGYAEFACQYDRTQVVDAACHITSTDIKLPSLQAMHGLSPDANNVPYQKVTMADLHTPLENIDGLSQAFKAAADGMGALGKSMMHTIVDEVNQSGAPISFNKDKDGEITANYFEGSKPMKQPNTQAGLKAGMSLADAVAHAQQAKTKTQGSKEAKLMSNPTATGLAGFFKTRVKVHFGKTVTVNAKGFGQLKQLIARVGKNRIYRAMECVLNNWDDFLLYVKQERNWTPDCTLPNIGILLHLADEMQEFYAMTTGDKDVEDGKTAYQTTEEVKQSNDGAIDDIWG